MPSGLAVIALLVLAGLVAVAGVIAVPTALADTTVWSATLTVKEFSGVGGCSNSVSGNECSSQLTDDDFTHDGATLEVTHLFVPNGNLEIEFSAAPSLDTQALQLRVSNTRELLSSRDSISQAGKRFTFADTGETFRDGQMKFSEEPDPDFSYRTLRDHAFLEDGNGYTVTRAQRTKKPGNRRWLITVQPGSDAEVLIVLPVTTDCNANGAICAADGRMLSNRVEFTVPGPDG